MPSVDGAPLAPQDSVGDGGAMGEMGATGTAADIPPSYQSQLSAWLLKHQQYPRRARRRRIEGTVVLHFVMDRNGRVLDWHIQSSSGHKLLDDAVAELIKRADPLPAMPAEINKQRLELTVPIQFMLR